MYTIVQFIDSTINESLIGKLTLLVLPFNCQGALSALDLAPLAPNLVLVQSI